MGEGCKGCGGHRCVMEGRICYNCYKETKIGLPCSDCEDMKKLSLGKCFWHLPTQLRENRVGDCVIRSLFLPDVDSYKTMVGVREDVNTPVLFHRTIEANNKEDCLSNHDTILSAYIKYTMGETTND